MYEIKSNGSIEGTSILENGQTISFNEVFIIISNKFTSTRITFEENGRLLDGSPDSVFFILGDYKIIGTGLFESTKVFYKDEILRGVQAVSIKISYATSTSLVLSILV